jgi:acyl-CoA thioesterase FadM
MRVKLQALDHYPHQCQLQVRVTDLNYGNHLGNDATVGLLQEARVQWLATFGAAEGDLGDGATGIIQTDLAITYLAEGRLHDRLTVDTALVERSRLSFRLAQRLRRGDTVLALAETGFLGFSYPAAKRAPLPPTFPTPEA